MKIVNRNSIQLTFEVEVDVVFQNYKLFYGQMKKKNDLKFDHTPFFL